MDCVSFIKGLYGIPRSIVTLIQVYNVLIGVVNIIGNGILIWALRRTGQTKTISLKFIIIMSFSDLGISIISIFFMSLMTLEQYVKHCWLKLVIQAVLNTFNCFSGLMVLLIATDRYLHMTFLERYSIIFTKRRGYLMVGVSFFLAAICNTALILPYSRPTYSIIKQVYFSFLLFFPLLIIILYYKAMRAMRRKANQISRNTINYNRTLGRAAKRISICFLILTTPIIICHILDGISMKAPVMDLSVLNAFTWLAYITFLVNGFCSSVIFMSQNILIRRLLRRIVMNYWNRIQSEVGTRK